MDYQEATHAIVYKIMQLHGWQTIDAAPKDKEVPLALWYIPSKAAFENGTKSYWLVSSGRWIEGISRWSGVPDGKPSYWFNGDHSEFDDLMKLLRQSGR